MIFQVLMFLRWCLVGNASFQSPEGRWCRPGHLTGKSFLAGRNIILNSRSIASRSGSGLPGATLRSGLIRRGPSSSEVSFLRSARRAANIQENIRRQGICKLRTHIMELSVRLGERRRSVAPLFQETFENSSVLTSCFCRHSEFEIWLKLRSLWRLRDIFIN